MHYRNEEPWKGYYNEDEMRSYNLATTNFYLNLKHQLDTSIEKAIQEIKKLEENSGPIKEIHFQVGRIEEARQTLGGLEIVFKASLQELPSNN